MTARARVPAMACVGGPAAGRGARRRRDLWRSSASRVAVTSKPLRQVEDFGDRRSKEQSADGDFPNALPNLGRRSGTTHTQTNRKVPPPAKTYRVARALFSRGRLISEASLPVFQRGWGRISEHSFRERTGSFSQPMVTIRHPRHRTGVFTQTVRSCRRAPLTLLC